MKRVLVASLIMGGLALAAAAQTPAPAPAPPTAPPDSATHFDVSADRSELKKINNETVLELTDNVRIVHGDVTVTANRGIHYTIDHVQTLPEYASDTVVKRGVHPHPRGR